MLSTEVNFTTRVIEIVLTWAVGAVHNTRCRSLGLFSSFCFLVGHSKTVVVSNTKGIGDVVTCRTPAWKLEYRPLHGPTLLDLQGCLLGRE